MLDDIPHALFRTEGNQDAVDRKVLADRIDRRRNTSQNFKDSSSNVDAQTSRSIFIAVNFYFFWTPLRVVN